MIQIQSVPNSQSEFCTDCDFTKFRLCSHSLNFDTKSNSILNRQLCPEKLCCDVNGALQFLAVSFWAIIYWQTCKSHILRFLAWGKVMSKVKLGLSSIERKFGAKCIWRPFGKLLKCNWCLNSLWFKLQSLKTLNLTF